MSAATRRAERPGRDDDETAPLIHLCSPSTPTKAKEKTAANSLSRGLAVLLSPLPGQRYGGNWGVPRAYALSRATHHRRVP
jgi:hypothetical protein